MNDNDDDNDDDTHDDNNDDDNNNNSSGNDNGLYNDWPSFRLGFFRPKPDKLG